MSSVMVEAHLCQRCGHYWLPQIKRRNVRPKVCPQCTSPVWDKAKPVMLKLASPGSNGGEAGNTGVASGL